MPKKPTKNILVYYNWQLMLPFYGIIIDHVNKLSKEGGSIYLLSCEGIIKNCLTNRLNDPKICNLCKYVKRSGLDSMPSDVKHISLEEYQVEKENDFDLSFNTIHKIKSIEYKGVKIGYGALSSYVSYTRNQEPLLDSAFKNYFKAFLDSQITIVDALENLNSQVEFSQVYLYNGRWADVRPVYDFFNHKNIYTGVIESVNNGTTEFYKEVYPNVLPQDIDYRTKEIKRVWSDSKLCDEEKYQQADLFFERKRNALAPRADLKIFTSEQDKNSLPNNFDSTKTNITIFNSSEDEFAALGEEWERYRIFKTQEEGVTAICKAFESDSSKHFYLRIHPNLGNVGYGYVSRLLELPLKFGNLTVVPADSRISSYSLMDNSEKVIVFGSSIGFEAAYADKPVILLGGTFYYFLNIAYIPRNQDELFKLISLPFLEPKPKSGAYMLAFYMLNHQQYSTLIDLNPIPIKVLGQKVGHYFRYTKTFGSPLLFRIIFQLWKESIDIYNRLFSKREIPRQGK